MKGKKIVSTLLALLLLASLPVSALAAEWDISKGDITVNAGSGGQTVTQGGGAAVEDSAPVITGSSTENTLTIKAESGQTANVTLSGANIKEYFLDLAQMQPGVYYGFYFLELAEYFGQEGNDETQMLNLLYVTMNAIRRGKQDLRLVRCIFELRTITISGEAPQMFSCMECSTKENLTVFSLRDSAIYCPNCGKTIRDPWPLQPGTVLACRYIIAAPLAKLYGFTVNEEILDELERLLRAYLHRYVEKKMKTLQILDVMK